MEEAFENVYFKISFKIKIKSKQMGLLLVLQK